MAASVTACTTLSAIEVGRDDRADVVERFRDRRVLLHETQPLRFRLLERRDVARDLRRADDPAGLVAHRRNRQGDIDRTATLREADRLEMVDALAPAQPREDVVFLRLAVWRNQHPDGPADHLVGRVAEQPLRGGVAGLDDAVEILRDDRVVGRVDDGGQVGLSRPRPVVWSETSRKKQSKP